MAESFKDFFENLIVESRSPKVGIFWIHKDQCLAFTEDVREIAPVGGFRNTKYDHYSSWRKLKIGGDWTQTPRGRVLFREKDKKFDIVTSKALASDQNAILKVMREFSLPMANTKVSTDEHYEMDPDMDFGDYFDD